MPKHSHLAIAIKCNTALVDPPSAITTTIALCSDFLVIMSRGFKSIFNSSRRCIPANRHSTNFIGSSAGVEELCIGKNKSYMTSGILTMQLQATKRKNLSIPSRKRHSHGFNGRGHSISSVHTTTCPCTRA